MSSNVENSGKMSRIRENLKTITKKFITRMTADILDVSQIFANFKVLCRCTTQPKWKNIQNYITFRVCLCFRTQNQCGEKDYILLYAQWSGLIPQYMNEFF